MDTTWTCIPRKKEKSVKMPVRKILKIIPRTCYKKEVQNIDMNIIFLLEKDSEMLTIYPTAPSHPSSQLKQDNSPLRAIGELENNTRKKRQSKEYACYHFNCTTFIFFLWQYYLKVTISCVYLYIMSASSLPNNICNILNAAFSATHCGWDSPKKTPM